MIISVINQKGGVSKTTSVFNIAGNLACQGYKVLQVDIDPQASLTIANGIEPGRLDKSIYDVLCEGVNIREVLHDVGKNLKICVSKLDLSVAELSLVNIMARETILKKVLKEVKNEFDFILIDCPPNLGLLTINALSASDKVIIPASTDYLSLRGADFLTKTVEKVKCNLNEDLEIIGIIAAMHNPRTTHSNEILQVYKNNYNVLGTISESVKVKDSILAGIPLCKFDPNHKTTLEYKKISDKLIEIRKKEN